MSPPRSEFAVRFGQNLARVRRGAGISQEELAFRAGMHRTAVGQLERGERVARGETLFKLACVLGVSPAEFFDGIVWRPGRYEAGAIGVEPAEGEAGPGRRSATG